MLSFLWLKLVDLLLMPFNGKKYSPQNCVGITEILCGALLLLDHLAFSKKSGSFRKREQEGPSYRECRKQVCCRYYMALLDHYYTTWCSHSVAAGDVWYLSPSHYCFLGLSLTLCLSTCIWRACSPLHLKATGFKTLFVHFDYRSSLNELIKTWILQGI